MKKSLRYCRNYDARKLSTKKAIDEWKRVSQDSGQDEELRILGK
jgi:hypothetical protein